MFFLCALFEEIRRLHVHNPKATDLLCQNFGHLHNLEEKNLDILPISAPVMTTRTRIDTCSKMLRILESVKEKYICIEKENNKQAKFVKNVIKGLIRI